MLGVNFTVRIRSLLSKVSGPVSRKVQTALNYSETRRNEKQRIHDIIFKVVNAIKLKVEMITTAKSGGYSKLKIGPGVSIKMR